MFIRRLRISRFRHIRDAEIGPLGAPPTASDLVAFVGPNGSGKSSVLELLGHALSNSWSLTWSIHRSFPESSFEVEIGLTTGEVTLVAGRLENPSSAQEKALEYLKQNRGYSRSFGFEEGEYAADPRLHNQAHSLVTSSLRDHHSRPLGFFLRSDRTYPFQTYQQRKLLQNIRRGERQHLWNLAFNTSDIQYQDMYDFLVEQQYHHDRRLGSYYRRQASGKLEEGEAIPEDPIQAYDQLLGRLFPRYSFTDPPLDIPDNLYVMLPFGERVSFQDLSSGEKEVFFILSFFLRNDVSEAVVVLDEPELHLHPELGRLLIRTMQEIRPGNQIWVGTHSGEIIDEAGRDRLFFLGRDKGSLSVQITPATDEPEAVRLLRELFGFSGFLGVARAMVFIEGRGSSLDRKIFGRLFSAQSGAVRIIPAGGSDSLPRINAAILQLLNSTFSACEFFLIRDRDYLTSDEVEAMEGRSQGRLWVLKRNQIENYLLDPQAIAAVETEILDSPCTVQEAENGLKAAARRIAGETLREMLSFRMNRVFGLQDFSLGDVLQGQESIDENGNWNEMNVGALRDRFSEKVAANLQESVDAASAVAVERLFERCQAKLQGAITGEGWRSLFPGKRLLEEYARGRGHASAVVPTITNSLVKHLSTTLDNVPEDLRRIVSTVVGGSETASRENKPTKVLQADPH